MPYYQLVPAGPFWAIRVGYGCTVEAATTGACPYGARTMKNSIKTRGQGSAVTLTFNVPGELADVFDFVVAEDILPKVLTGYGFLPGVVRTSSNTGPWDTPGSSRTVHLADGTTAREQVTAYERPQYFGYRTDRYTFALRHLANSATGQWWFNAQSGGTHVKWTYGFDSKRRLTAPILILFIRLQWGGYMRTCAKNVQRHFTRR